MLNYRLLHKRIVKKFSQYCSKQPLISLCCFIVAVIVLLDILVLLIILPVAELLIQYNFLILQDDTNSFYYLSFYIFMWSLLFLTFTLPLFVIILYNVVKNRQLNEIRKNYVKK